MQLGAQGYLLGFGTVQGDGQLPEPGGGGAGRSQGALEPLWRVHHPGAGVLLGPHIRTRIRYAPSPRRSVIAAWRRTGLGMVWCTSWVAGCLTACIGCAGMTIKFFR